MNYMSTTRLSSDRVKSPLACLGSVADLETNVGAGIKDAHIAEPGHSGILCQLVIDSEGAALMSLVSWLWPTPS
jgi:hypothetical protein